MPARQLNLLPISNSTAEARGKKRAQIVRHYNVRGPFLFLHVNLLDNRGEFSAPLEISLRKEGNDYVAEVFGVVAVANTIAFVSDAIDPISIFIGLTRRGLMGQAFRYLLFGEGETGLMVYTVLLRYWDWTRGEDVGVSPKFCECPESHPCNMLHRPPCRLLISNELIILANHTGSKCLGLPGSSLLS